MVLPRPELGKVSSGLLLSPSSRDLMFIQISWESGAAAEELCGLREGLSPKGPERGGTALQTHPQPREF